MVLAVFSYRYDAELVPGLIENIKPVVDGWVAFDDRGAGDLFSNEPRRRRLLVDRARQLGATWVLAMDPDERIERGAATRIRGLTSERRRTIWEVNLREMFTAETFRVDGVWGTKMQGRIFPVFDGPLNSDQPLHGAWCVPSPGYRVLPAGLNLYHLKMLEARSRHARRDLYAHLDPDHIYQRTGYDYLVDESDAAFERIPPGRDFFPAHRESGHAKLYMADVLGTPVTANSVRAADSAHCPPTAHGTGLQASATTESQLGQLRVSVGAAANRACDLAVVVIGLGAPRSLARAVDSLVAQNTPAEIIVVNSGGGDAAGVLREHLSAIVLVEVAEPVYVGAARNIGIQASRAPFVAFLAGDCRATPGWVERRVQAHLDGERAIGSVVANDRTWNPFAWAAHLMTYGHRVTSAGGDGGVYGASYDRALFDKYGYFSEALRIGEDSEFHARFRPSDPVRLDPLIRTIHASPAGPWAFLKDQVQRGRRGRHMADFFGAEFTPAYILRSCIGRITRGVGATITHLNGRERLAAIASWPLLPVGTVCYLIGMIASYVRARAAERTFRMAARSALFGRPDAAIALMARAIALRPGTARYHLALADLWRRIGRFDDGAREHYRCWDLDGRASALSLHDIGRFATDLEVSSSIGLELKVVVFADSSATQLAEFLNAVETQGFRGTSQVIVVESGRSGDPEAMRQVRRAFGGLVTFVSPRGLEQLICADAGGSANPCVVAVSSASCVPPPDWLATLVAQLTTHPEIELFHGSCQPLMTDRAGFIERLGRDLGFYPRAAGQQGLLYFAHSANWACSRALLCASGGFSDRQGDLLGMWTLTERVMRVGGSCLNAPEWQTLFRMDATLAGLWRRFYWDGYYGARHVTATDDRDVAVRLFSLHGLPGSAAAAWKFALSNLRVWRFANRSVVLSLLVLILLLSFGIARQAGWYAGRRRPRGDSFTANPESPIAPAGEAQLACVGRTGRLGSLHLRRRSARRGSSPRDCAPVWTLIGSRDERGAGDHTCGLRILRAPGRVAW
jgi:glycosyltransferase involved in cell wall biosynthesis